MSSASAKANRPATTWIVWITGLMAADLVRSHDHRFNTHSRRTQMFEAPPDGFFIRDLLVFKGLRQGGYVAKGFVFEPPDLNNAQISELNDFQNQISLVLASLNDDQR